MLEKLLNKKVRIYFGNFAVPPELGQMSAKREGIVTAIDKEFIELDNDLIIAIKYVTRIKLA